MVGPHFFSLELMVVDIVEFMETRTYFGETERQVRLIPTLLGSKEARGDPAYASSSRLSNSSSSIVCVIFS
jgi:hypothetical protein